jgi:hypothetical protein
MYARTPVWQTCTSVQAASLELEGLAALAHEGYEMLECRMSIIHASLQPLSRLTVLLRSARIPGLLRRPGSNLAHELVEIPFRARVWVLFQSRIRAFPFSASSLQVALRLKCGVGESIQFHLIH